MAEHADIGEALFAVASVAVRGRQRDLSLTEGSTLSTLERTGPRRLTDLAMHEGVTQPSMTSVVNQLEHLGLAERHRDPDDRRVVLVAITPAGCQHLRAMRRAGASVFTVLIDKLSKAHVNALRAALPALHDLVGLATEGHAGRARPPGRKQHPGPRPNAAGNAGRGSKRQ
jgi:DNA-binding MarR family transcriptional regulator